MMRPRFPALALSLSLTFAAGCSWTNRLRSAASVEHNCPQEHVVIVADDGNTMARTVQMDVCGERRVYRDIGGSQATIWVDVTRETSGGESGRASSGNGALTSFPDDFPTAIRQRIDAAAARVIACAGSDSAAIEATWSADGAVHLGVRGETDMAVDECVAAAVGVIEVPTGAEPGRLLHSISR